MQTLPRFTDLRRLATSLADDERYKRLTTTIDKAATAQSCVADLEQALHTVEALDALLASPRKKGTIGRQSTENALLVTATLLYCRATATSGKRGERGSINIADWLKPDELLDHEAIVATRNRALAHVYARESIGGDVWHNVFLFAASTADGFKLGGATHSLQFHRRTLERLRRQLPLAIELVTQQSQKHLGRIGKMLQDNDAPVKAFLDNEFDPVKRFGSLRTVESILAGGMVGRATAIGRGRVGDPQ